MIFHRQLIGGAASLLIALLLLGNPISVRAETVVAKIDLSEQRMVVSIDGWRRYSWLVSTARPGYRTPVGSFHPIRLEREWYSTKYDYAPMPYSIFFLGGYAIHGTTEIAHLGRAVSHGCVRLHPDNARTLFNLVLKYGRSETLIRIVR